MAWKSESLFLISILTSQRLDRRINGRLGECRQKPCDGLNIWCGAVVSNDHKLPRSTKYLYGSTSYIIICLPEGHQLIRDKLTYCHHYDFIIKLRTRITSSRRWFSNQPGIGFCPRSNDPLNQYRPQEASFTSQGKEPPAWHTIHKLKTQPKH